MVRAATTLQSMSGLFTQRLAGQIRSVKPFHTAAMHFANNEKIIYLRKICWFGRMEHIPKKYHYARCPVLELFCNSLCGPLPKIWESPGLLDSQSLTRRRRCHCWELQDESFAFCGRISSLLHAWIFSAGLQHAFDLIDFLLRATK